MPGSPARSPFDLRSPWFAAACFGMGLAVAAWLMGGGGGKTVTLGNQSAPGPVDPDPAPDPVPGPRPIPDPVPDPTPQPVTVDPQVKRAVRAEADGHRGDFQRAWEALTRNGIELERRSYPATDAKWDTLVEHAARKSTVGNAHLFALNQLGTRVGADYTERLGDFSQKKPRGRAATEASYREWRDYSEESRALAERLYEDLVVRTRT